MFSLVTQILNTYGRVCLLGARLGQNKRPHQQPYKTISVTTTAMDKVTNKLAKTRSTQLQLQLQCRARRGHGRCYRQSPGTTDSGQIFPQGQKGTGTAFLRRQFKPPPLTLSSQGVKPHLPQEIIQAPTPTLHPLTLSSQGVKLHLPQEITEPPPSIP